MTIWEKIFLLMKKFQYTIFLLSTLVCSGHEILSLPVPKAEEVLFLNRIADFWEEGEYLIAKNQIQEFITLYPESHFADVLHAAIGEIFLREKNYSTALDSYAKIKDAQIGSSVFPHRIECLYNMQWYPILIDECEAHLQNSQENTPFVHEITYYLAMSLYQQCANTEDSKTINALVLRAEPYFVKLIEKEHPVEMAIAFAHLLWMNQEVERSTSMYASLAEKNPELEELQQEAALMQMKLIQFYNKNQKWKQCQDVAKKFLSQFPDHPHALIAQQFLIEASANQANNGPEEKEQFIIDLEMCLAQEPESRNHQMLLAKTHFSLRHFKEAIPLFQTLLEDETLSKEDLAEASLLLALCYRDGANDLENFAILGEKALLLCPEQKLMSSDDLHAALYNGYLELGALEKTEAHLFALFEKQKVDPDNLLFLADRYFQRRFIEEESKTRAILILETLPLSESTVISLSKLYLQIDQKDKAITLLESWIENNPSQNALFLLAEQQTDPEKALPLFQEIYKNKSALKTWAGASASLQSAKIQISRWDQDTLSAEDPEVQNVLTQLKSLILQKTFSNEPLYLEAALEYIDLQNLCHKSPAKKIFLLQKIKKDFENSDDLLSKDYHQERSLSIEKNRIYQSYIQFLDASIYLSEMEIEKEDETQKQLQAKAKDLLLRVIEEQASPALVARAEQCLNR